MRPSYDGREIVIEIAIDFERTPAVLTWNPSAAAQLSMCGNCRSSIMRKRPINHVYEVLRAVCELEKELKTGALSTVINREGCSEHLKQARHELHQVLDQVYASDFRGPHAA